MMELLGLVKFNSKLGQIFAAGLLGLFLLNGCEYTKFKKDINNIKSIPKLSQKEMDQLSFQKVFNEVIDSYCLSCHREGKFPLNNYSQVFAKRSDIYKSVFVEGSMPKKKVLPLRERSILYAWLDIGAPEFGKVPTAPLPPLEPTYSSIRERIFNVRCGNCHSPQSEECLSVGKPNKKIAAIKKDSAPVGTQDEEDKGFNGESCSLELGIYDELLNGQDEKAKELILPGNPDDSQLILVIKPEEEGKAPEMPPKKQGYNPLSAEEVKAIEDWIRAGALNN